MGLAPPFAERTSTPNLTERCDCIYFCIALFKKRFELSSVQCTLLMYSGILDLFSIVCLTLRIIVGVVTGEISPLIS
jgi:hypothetical protein